VAGTKPILKVAVKRMWPAKVPLAPAQAVAIHRAAAAAAVVPAINFRNNLTAQLGQVVSMTEFPFFDKSENHYA
jgi:hypothetical protein